MTAFVVWAHHAVVHQRFTPCLSRNSWTGQRAISHQTSQICGRSFIRGASPSQAQSKRQFSTPQAMFSGGGGILGVGASEVIVIVAVGWLLLGPQKLFSLAKDSGRLLGELRRTADEAKDSFNEAMELDVIAAEFEEGKRAVEENGTPDSLKDDKRSDESDKLLSTADEATEESEQSNNVEIDIEPATNSAFLQQLQRVADPNQKAPSEVPDLDFEFDEELEVQRLEKEYFEARDRLEKRRKERGQNTASESEPVVEERKN